MDSTFAVSGCRVALLGLDQHGWFHWERWRLRGGVQVVAVADADPFRRRAAEHESAAVLTPEQLVASAGKWDAVVVTFGVAQREHWIWALLETGRPVWVEPPVADTWAETRRLMSHVDHHGGSLHVLSPRRADDDYQTALAALKSGRLGLVISARSISAEYAPWASGSEYVRGQTLAVCGPPLFDQLAGLIVARPRRIWAHAFPGEDGFSAAIEFADNTWAHLEIRRAVRVAHRTGWMLEGDLGSYHQRRLYTTTTDGEIVDEAVAAPSTPTTELYDGLLQAAGVADAHAERQRALTAAGLFEATQRALTTGESIPWDVIVCET